MTPFTWFVLGFTVAAFLSNIARGMEKRETKTEAEKSPTVEVPASQPTANFCPECGKRRDKGAF
jgi:hypothetical protein